MPLKSNLRNIAVGLSVIIVVAAVMIGLNRPVPTPEPDPNLTLGRPTDDELVNLDEPAIVLQILEQDYDKIRKIECVDVYLTSQFCRKGNWADAKIGTVPIERSIKAVRKVGNVPNAVTLYGNRERIWFIQDVREFGVVRILPSARRPVKDAELIAVAPRREFEHPGGSRGTREKLEALFGLDEPFYDRSIWFLTHPMMRQISYSRIRDETLDQSPAFHAPPGEYLFRPPPQEAIGDLPPEIANPKD